MREIFYELIKEAKDGKVIIDSEEWPIGFNTIVYDGSKVLYELINPNNLSTLIIKDLEEFMKKLETYLEIEKDKCRKSIKFYRDPDKNNLKLLMIYLFVNATVNDFSNPSEFIDRTIEFLKDDTFSYLNDSIVVPLGELFFGSNLKIKNTLQSVLMETPNKIEITFENFDGDTYKLPTISYGIKTNSKDEKECYIYSILNDKKNIDSKFSKKISRLLYKLNKGIMDIESGEYLEFLEGNSTYYPENISDVSPSSVLSLVIFLNLLKKEGIKKIKVVPYLPLRYLSRSLVARDSTLKEKLEKRNDEIQTNITDKFIRTFRRVMYYIKDMQIISYPYELSEFLEISLGVNKTNSNNELINQVSDSMNKKI